MVFLIIEFAIVAVLGRILESILDIVAPFTFGTRPPFGHAFIPLYLWLSVRLYQHFVRNEPRQRKTNLSVAYLYKLAFTVLITYLLVNVYGFGDFQGYYSFPYWASERLRSFNWEAIKNIEVVSGYFFKNWTLNSTTVIGYVFSALFVVFPPSLYGMSLLSGTIVFIATFKLYGILEPHLEKKWRPLFFLFYFFSPAITLQLGYTGKETIVFPLIVGFIIYTHRGGGLAARLLFLGVVFYIRFYQAFFLIIAWIGSRLTLRQIFSVRGIPVLAFGAVGLTFIIKEVIARIGGFGFNFSESLTLFLSTTYEAGSLVLKPFPFPLTFLQPFRPFLWEAHNALAIVTSVELVAWFGVTAYLLAMRGKVLRERFRHDRFFRFLAIYVMVQFFVFSHIDNMGDLVRRKIYFLPLFLGLLCYARMQARDLTARPQPGGIRRGTARAPASLMSPDTAAPSPQG